MMRFHILFPDVAEKECRAITLSNHESLPDRTFLFVERYCVEPRCDCRRVILEVLDTVTHTQVATINHAFEPPEPPYDDEEQTFLDPLNPQSNWSPALFKLTYDMLETDTAYRERLVRHYKMWKSVVDDPSHPDHAKIRTEDHDDPNFKPAFPKREPVRRETPKLSPNAPCPCGSGKKYKMCCRP